VFKSKGRINSTNSPLQIVGNEYMALTGWMGAQECQDFAGVGGRASKRLIMARMQILAKKVSR
jgi:hypothetical protein